MGIKVLKLDFAGNRNYIDLTTLSPGTYLLRCLSNRVSYAKKIIIE